MRWWLAALAAVTLLRLVVAAAMPLSPDEAYYWVWARTLQPAYFDHPPMVALFVWAGISIAGETALGVRLLGPFAMALGSVLLARAANALFPDARPGVWAAALVNATLFAGVGSVVITPDTPLLLFWTCAIWALARLYRTQDARWWLAFGLFSGLALASKYSAVLLGLGVVLWLACTPSQRHWFARWQLWAGGAVAAACFAPVLLWNAQQEWASFAMQGSRAVRPATGQALAWVGDLVGGQVGLATPIIFVLCVAATGAAARAWWRGDAVAGLLAAFALPGAALVLWRATGMRIEGNWPAPLYVTAAVAAAARPVGRSLPWRLPAVALGGAMTVAVYVHAVTAALPIPPRLDVVTGRLAGWQRLAEEAHAIAARQRAAFVAAELYWVAAMLAWHAPPGSVVVAAEPRWRHFRLDPAPADAPGLLVRTLGQSLRGPPAWPGAVAAEPPRLERWHGERPVDGQLLHRVRTGQGEPATAIMPRRR